MNNRTANVALAATMILSVGSACGRAEQTATATQAAVLKASPSQPTSSPQPTNTPEATATAPSVSPTS
ncbi:MAG: hypothetical protein PVI63_09560, partial [Anaerolineae bacterium]